jgi:hypothetical protein
VRNSPAIKASCAKLSKGVLVKDSNGRGLDSGEKENSAPILGSY